MDVVVIGAGLAGLACAFRLQRRGYEVMVLERERGPGGRARHAAIVAAGDTAACALAREAGVALEPYGDAIWLGCDGRLEPWELSLAPIPAAAVDDAENAAQALARSIGAERLARELGPLLVARCGAPPGALSATLALRELSALAKEPRLSRLAGGGAAFARALGQGVDLRVGFEVTALEPDLLGVGVRYVAPSGERRLRASAVVVATPPPDAVRLAAAFTPGERELLAAVRFTRELSARIELSGSPLGDAGGLVAFAASGDVALAALWVEPAAPGERSRARAVFRAAAADELWGAPDARVLERMRGDLAETPFAHTLAADLRVERFALARPLFAPGYPSALAAFHARTQRTARVAFAGDAFEAPTLEGAVASGLRAAAEVAHQLD